MTASCGSIRFLDGNGRVTRLIPMPCCSAYARHGSRVVGRARLSGIEAKRLIRGIYRSAILNVGTISMVRGNLSAESLGSFTHFLNTCIDQVGFMESLMQPDRLRTRIFLWAEEETRMNSTSAEGRQLSLKPFFIGGNCRVETSRSY